MSGEKFLKEFRVNQCKYGISNQTHKNERCGPSRRHCVKERVNKDQSNVGFGKIVKMGCLGIEECGDDIFAEFDL